jgi:TonB-dependent receptor
LDFRLSYAYAAEEEPDRRDVTFRLDGVDMEYDITDTDFPVIAADPDVGVFDESAYGIDELVSENNETTDKALSARLDVSQARTFGTFRSELKSGVKARFKSKDRRKDIRVYQWAGDDLRLAQVAGDFEDDQFLDDRYRFGLSPGPHEVEELFTSERDGRFVENSIVSRVESDPNNYDASKDTYAAYAQAKTGVGRWMAVVGGRYELTSIEYESNEVMFDDDGRYEGTNSTSGDNDYGRFFPAAHLRYRLDDRTNLRVAWTNALARPDYYDLAPYSVVSRNDEEIIRGNPALDPTTAVNFDFLAERYLSSVGIVSVAFFYKSLDDYIYRRTFDETNAKPLPHLQRMGRLTPAVDKSIDKDR